MKRLTLKLLAASSLVFAMAGSASAHRAWLLPSTFTLSGDAQWVTVDAAISNDLFFPNHHAIDPASITVTAPDGSHVAIAHAAEGEIRSMFDVRMDQQGTYRISTAGAPSYFAGWMENGERKRWRGTLETLRAEGIDKKPGVEVSQAQRSVETFVTLGAPSTEVFTPTGTGLEFRPVTHPNDVFTGEPVSFRLLLDGAPASGLDVTILPGNDRYRDTPGELSVKTDTDGVFTFTPELPGPYWLTTGSEGETTVDGMAMKVRTSYTATFEALPL
jgi:uncharacterized GH25 family protein